MLLLESTYLLSTSIFSNVIWRLHLLMLDLNIICYIQRGFSSLMCILFTFLYCLLWSYIKKVLKENKSYARASFFPIEMKYIFTTTISHDARFSGERSEVLFCIQCIILSPKQFFDNFSNVMEYSLGSSFV